MFKLLDVFFENKEIDSGGARVNSYSVEFYKKTYDLYEEINYDKREPFTVNNNIHYQNEIKYLKKLEHYDITPKIIDINYNSLILSNCGECLNEKNLPQNWKEQIYNIYKILKKENIYHNDMKLDNFTVKNEQIFLIDFGWSSDNIPGYPYLNINIEIINNSDNLNELFNKIYNKCSSLILNCGLNLNSALNDLRTDL